MENGGGYDDFIHKMADDSNIPHDNIISAVEVSGLAPAADSTPSATAESGHDHDHGEFNEHVWYSLQAMGKPGRRRGREAGQRSTPVRPLNSRPMPLPSSPD